MNQIKPVRLRVLPVVVGLILAGLPVWTLHAQYTNRAQMFYDDFEIAAHSSAYTIAQMQANNSLGVNSVPGPAELGTWQTWNQADGANGTFGVQVTYNVDPPSNGTYQGTNVLRILRAPVGSGSSTMAKFINAQTGGQVRVSWKGMYHDNGSIYNEMIHFDSNPVINGSEGSDSAITSFVIGASTVHNYDGGWNQITGLTPTPDTWQNYQVDFDLDNEQFTVTIDSSTAGPIPFGSSFAPSHTLGALTFRGGSSQNDLFYVDQLQAFPLSKPINITHTPTDGQSVDATTPIVYTLVNGFNSTTSLNLDTNTVKLYTNGVQVTAQILQSTSDTNTYTVSYTPPSGWPTVSTQTITLTFSDTEGPPVSTTNTFSFIVLPPLASTVPRQQDDTPEALLVIEAEDYDRNIPSVATASVDAMSWTPTTSPSGYSGASAMYAGPETFDPSEGGGPMKVNVGNNVSNSPRMDYKVRFTRTGTHWFWVRGYGKDSASDSVHIGLDGNSYSEPISGFPYPPPQVYAWTDTQNGSTAKAVFVPSVGYHYVTIWMRENGFELDKLLITANGNYTPTSVGPAETAPGPVSDYWRFEEASGFALDIDSDVPSPGTLKGGAARTNAVFAAVVPRSGAANTESINIPGTDGSGVDMGTSVNTGTGDFTLQGWIYARTIPGGTAFIAGKHITSEFSGKGYELVANSSGGGFTVSAAISAGGSTVTATSAALTLGQWYHVAAVRGGGNLKLYVNGVQAASVTDSIPGADLTSSQHFSVGGAIQVDSNFHIPFDGYIDEVRITLAALSSSALLNAPRPTRPTILSRLPTPGSTGVPGSTNIAIVLQDGTVQVVTNSIQLSFNGSPVSPVITQGATNPLTTTITYQPPSALVGGSLNTVTLIYSDNGSPAQTVTNTFSFTVAYVPISKPSYWRFEEGSGSTALDSIGPFPGTLLSNAVYSSDVPTNPIPQTGAANNWSMSFDGTGAAGSPGTCVDMGPAVQVVSNDFTIECWVKVTGDPNGGGMILGKLGTGLFSDKFFSLSHQAPNISGLLSFEFSMTGGNVLTTPYQYNMNQWYHLAGVRQGTAIRIYVDGALVSSGTLNTYQDFTSDQHFCVAGGASGGIVNMQGLVDEARLSPGALAPAFFLNSPPPPIITFSRNGNQLTLSWLTAGMKLQQNSSLNNAAGWTDVAGGTTSPVIVTTTGAPKFYRLINQ